MLITEGLLAQSAQPIFYLANKTTHAMKIEVTKVLTILCLAVVLSSCEKDNEKDIITLVGKWKVFSDERKGCDDPIFNYFNNRSSCTSTNCIEITFTSDGKTIENYGNGSFIDEGTYWISGNQVFVCLHFIYMCYEFTYKINGSTLTLTYDDEFGCTNVVVLKR